jgi:hypothetical protein
MKSWGVRIFFLEWWYQFLYRVTLCKSQEVPRSNNLAIFDSFLLQIEWSLLLSTLDQNLRDWKQIHHRKKHYKENVHCTLRTTFYDHPLTQGFCSLTTTKENRAKMSVRHSPEASTDMNCACHLQIPNLMYWLHKLGTTPLDSIWPHSCPKLSLSEGTNFRISLLQKITLAKYKEATASITFKSRPGGCWIQLPFIPTMCTEKSKQQKLSV